MGSSDENPSLPLVPPEQLAALVARLGTFEAHEVWTAVKDDPALVGDDGNGHARGWRILAEICGYMLHPADPAPWGALGLK
jgi:hypothetical protein